MCMASKQKEGESERGREACPLGSLSPPFSAALYSALLSIEPQLAALTVGGLPSRQTLLKCMCVSVFT